MKEAENVVKIEGILSEIDVKETESTKDGKPYISGKIVIKVRQEINGEQVDTEVPVYVFATKMTKKGTVNPSYESIKKFLDGTYVSIAACGDEAKADYVRVTNGQLSENAFYNQNGTLLSEPRVRASFFSKIKAAECTPMAVFSNVIVIGNIADEIKNNDPTGRLEVTGVIPQYGDKVDVLKFHVANQNAIDHINSYWNKGDTVRVVGKLNYRVTVESKVEEMGFGEPVVTNKTSYVRDLIIISGSQGGFDEDQAYSSDEVKTALAARQAVLTALKDKAANTAAPAVSTTTAKKDAADFGF